MAYVLGYIAADGCISKRKRAADSFTLNITSKDRQHLCDIKKVLRSDHKISRKRSDPRHTAFQLQISNQLLCRDLLDMGIVQRKTRALRSISVPKPFFRDFARGFFDGDGTVYIYRVNGTAQIKAGLVCASHSFLSDLNRNLCRSLGIREKSIHRMHEKGRGVPLYSVYFYVDDCEKLSKFFYGQGTSLCLRRKRRIFANWTHIKRRTYAKTNYPSKVGWHLKY